MTPLLFRAGALYFRKIAVDAMQSSAVTQYNGNAVCKELLRALESARTRLAIAIAEETKSTPRSRRQYYLDTADQLRTCIGRLRKVDGDLERDYESWALALQALKQLPVQNNAFQLCLKLREIVTDLVRAIQRVW
jgi:hypothetical protein